MGIYDRVLITGGGGMLAKALIRALQERGHGPNALAREQLDITDPDAVKRAVDDYRPTLILNSAAYTKVDQCEQKRADAMAINANGAGLMAHAAAYARAKLVHYSTDFVFSGEGREPYRVGDETDPKSFYGFSKRAGEDLITKNPSRDYLIIRTAWLYGPGGPCFPQTMINAAKAGKPLRVVNDQIGSPTFTHDLAEATLNLIDANAHGVYHVTNSGQTSWFDFTRAILEEFNLTADLAPTTSAEWKKLHPTAATRPAYSVLDTSKYEQTTGKTMRHWREALKAYHAAIGDG
jgi:dTDP-4-dehydrorhamnose reductase